MISLRNPSRPIKRILLLAAALLQTTTLLAQVDSLVFAQPSEQVVSDEAHELRVSIDGLAFFRDNEYNTHHAMKGYTLPGLWLAPSVSYQPLKNLKLEAGVYMLHYWGASQYPNGNYSTLEQTNEGHTAKAFHCTPIFRANLQLTPEFNLVLGTLYGKTQHRLTQPLYNDEMNLTADPETGLQLLWKLPWMHFDTWVNWQDFIFKKDDHQERFTFGLSTQLFPSRRTARAQWYIPLQLLMQHTGGEINTEANDRMIKTWLNAATGVGMNVPLQTKLPVTLGAECIATYYSQQAGTALPFNKGGGLLASLRANVWRMGLTASYWQAKQFISIFGSPLYGAMSTSEDNTTLHKPKMVLLQADYAQQLARGFSWGVRLQFDWHTQRYVYHCTTGVKEQPGSSTDLAAGIYLRFNPSFLIKKF